MDYLFISHNIAFDVVYATFCWAVGFIAVTQTKWCVRMALTLQRAYPQAFSSRLAERIWYPTFLKVSGCACLLLAAKHTVMVSLAFWLR